MLSLYFLAQGEDSKRRSYQCQPHSKQLATTERAHPDAGVSVSTQHYSHFQSNDVLYSHNKIYFGTVFLSQIAVTFTY